MKRFVFRPQAALDLRRKQDEVAQRARAVAAANVARAKATLNAAREAISSALAQAREGQLEAAQGTHLALWHRNWMIALTGEEWRCSEALAARRVDEEAAIARAQEARKRLRALERLRARAWESHQRAAARAEQQAIDELATRRHATRNMFPEGG